MATASAHNIVILGVQGAGKTLYLYRLVASFLEWRGIGRETLRASQPDEFVAAARAEGVKFDTDTEAFLKRVHADVAEHGAPHATPANAATGHPTITLEFPSLGLEITADDIPGELLTRAAHMVANERAADDPDGTVQNFMRQLQSRFRTCDGVLFFHPPHQSEIEAESEMALRRFAQLALRANPNKFLPFVVVFTKDDVWAEGGREPGGEGHTRHMTQMAGMAEAVMSRREHFTSTYWRALQDWHHSDLSHPYWSDIASIYGTGRNFTSISALRGSFAELRSPVDMVYRLNREIARFFRSTFTRNVQVAFAGLVLMAAITIIALWLMPYAAGVDSSVPNFQSPREVIVFIHEAQQKDDAEKRLLDGLKGLENAIIVSQEQLQGATSDFTWKSFVVYRDYIARLEKFDKVGDERNINVLRERVQEIRKDITASVGGWLDRASAGEPIDSLPDTWFEVCQRYVDGLGPMLKEKDGAGSRAWTEWRDLWRRARMARLQAALAVVDRNDAWFSSCAQLLESFWRDYVLHHTTNTSLRFLRFPQDDPNAILVDKARQFADRGEKGTLQLVITFDKLHCPNKLPTRHATALPKGLNAVVIKGDRQPVQSEVVLQTDSNFSDSPRVFLPREPLDESQTTGAIPLDWKPGENLQLKLVGRDNSARAWITVDLERESEGFRAPLPGLWPWFYRVWDDEEKRFRPKDAHHESLYGTLHFRVSVPDLPKLLSGDTGTNGGGAEDDGSGGSGDGDGG